MGYCVTLTDNNFKFKKENSENILKSLKDFVKTHDLRWVDEYIITNAECIEECFEELRYLLVENGSYYEIDEFLGEKLGDEEKIFGSIAQYIDKGSYLEYVGEDGDRFRLVFDGNKCEYKYLEIGWN